MTDQVQDQICKGMRTSAIDQGDYYLVKWFEDLLSRMDIYPSGCGLLSKQIQQRKKKGISLMVIG